MNTEIGVAEVAGEVEVEVDYGQAVQMELVATWWHWLLAGHWSRGQKAGNHTKSSLGNLGKARHLPLLTCSHAHHAALPIRSAERSNLLWLGVRVAAPSERRVNIATDLS
jgi:hypothetical protein